MYERGFSQKYLYLTLGNSVCNYSLPQPPSSATNQAMPPGVSVYDKTVELYQCELESRS